MKVEADLHVHTVASGHAYSTVDEIARWAASKGLKLVAITDHGPQMPGGPHEFHFGNIAVVPEKLYGVRILKGVEANILTDGGLDLPDHRLEGLDFVAAGIHGYADYKNKTRQEHTGAIIKAIQNPFVRMITHPATLYYPLDMEAVVKAAAEYNVIMEINASSFDKIRGGKRGSVELSVELCRLAREYNVPLSLNSDAHFYMDVGKIDTLRPVIKKAGLKPEDVINCSYQRLLDFLVEGKEYRSCAI